MIIWVWVGRGCNHLGGSFDETPGLMVVLYSRFKCTSGFLFNLMSPSFLLTTAGSNAVDYRAPNVSANSEYLCTDLLRMQNLTMV